MILTMLKLQRVRSELRKGKKNEEMWQKKIKFKKNPKNLRKQNYIKRDVGTSIRAQQRI